MRTARVANAMTAVTDANVMRPVCLQRPSLRHRNTLGGAAAEAEGGDGDLLKAIRWAAAETAA
jgi:hypothetical protein